MITSSFKKTDRILNVTLLKNQFSTEENSLLGRVTRNTVTLESLNVSITELNTGIWFSSFDTASNVSKNEEPQHEISEKTVSGNKPRALEFYVPESITATNYEL